MRIEVSSNVQSTCGDKNGKYTTVFAGAVFFGDEMFKKHTAVKLIFGVAAIGLSRSILRKFSEYNVSDKTVLITGGSRGLGLVLAREFARQGSRVVICARNDQELERARIDLQRLGAQVLALGCDVTSSSEVTQMVEKFAQNSGR